MPVNVPSDEAQTVRNLVDNFNVEHLMLQRRKRWASHDADGDAVTSSTSDSVTSRDSRKVVQVFEPIVATVSPNDSFLTSKAGKNN